MSAVIHLPAYDNNPYNRLLAEGLSLASVETDLWFNAPVVRNQRSLLPRLRQADLVHWHWLQHFYQARTPLRSLGRSAIFASVMAELRWRGIPQVVTVHNLIPHNCQHKALNERMCRVVGSLSDRIIVHNEDSIASVVALYGNRKKIRVVPHVDYPVTELSTSRKQLRNRWGLERFDRYAILFGLMRRYKRVECAVDAAKELASQGIGLIIAGPVFDPAYAEELHLRDSDKLVVFRLQYQSDEALAELLCLSDAALLLHGDALTSGVAHLALAYGLPLVTTDALAFRALVRRRLAFSCDPLDRVDLVESVLKAVASRGPAWAERVAAYRADASVEAVGEQVAAIYREIGLEPGKR